ncbi:hypothetical protein H310_12273 [Aphanomyces invadans]|uniref:6-phosphofructo-2-kinase domain-containing protein n=1 Tax=Aphanomyces invadans TaxID=157072 RepID=A0A024TK20_9STRA|nr:hypothetical protein H310_12273 [Aphanomyces invadans]ETV93936.1 hypothetical protein H310_12273 [Aphanomyces invadans]|eukprot:XP_008877496.1 hypothetical protein H310_12273 [Aphanomyces invadans]
MEPPPPSRQTTVPCRIALSGWILMTAASGRDLIGQNRRYPDSSGIKNLSQHLNAVWKHKHFIPWFASMTGIKHRVGMTADMSGCHVEVEEVPTTARRMSVHSIKSDSYFMGENIVRSIAPQRLVLIMVGLPARGKSFVVRKLTKYCQWLNLPTRIFNAGDYRRQASLKGASAAFFDSNNAEAKQIRDDLAMTAVENLIQWLEEGGQVAVLDATNTTKERRALVWDKFKNMENTQVMHIELVCDNPALLEANYLRKLKNEDYAGMDPQVALDDFKMRVEQYEKVYETLHDSENDGKVCYCKVYNAGEKVLARLCQSFLPSQIVSFLQNIHVHPRKIWLVRPGPNENGKLGILGGDEELTEEGHVIGAALGKFMANAVQQNKGFVDVWSSPMKRATQTAAYIHHDHVTRTVTTTLLNEVGGGDFAGYTCEELQKEFPQHVKARHNDKLYYRYPGAGGESYMDLIYRLRPVVIEFERKKRDCLVICSESVLRCLMGYFMGVDAQQVPYLPTKKGVVFELSPHRDGCDIKEFELEY